MKQEEEKINNVGLFDFLNGQTKDKKIFDFEDSNLKSSYKPYLINYFISSIDYFVPLVNNINKIWNYNIPKKMHYMYYFYALPERFFKFSPGKKVKEKNFILGYISHFYEIGLNDAKYIYKKITNEDIEEILVHYKTREDEKPLSLDKL